MDIASLLTGASIALVAPIVSGYFNFFVKKKEFQNEYYKQIVLKRLQAYEQLNTLVYDLKITVQDNDGQAYHFVFSDEKSIVDFWIKMTSQMPNSFWYSQNLNTLVLDLSKEFSKFIAENEYSQTPYPNIGKKVYMGLATLRDKIEQTLADDLPKLYDVNDFLKNKKVVTGFLKRNLLGAYFENDEDKK